MKTNEQIYTEVTDRLVRALEAGTVPWQRPWALAGRPRSLSTRKPYRGVNVLLLGITAAERGYASPFWGTSRQINALGGHIRKGQSKANDAGGTEVLLWKSAVKHEDDAENPGQKVDRKILLARTFYVFNADQCEGLPARFYPQAGAPVEDLADPQAVLDGYLAQPGAPSFAYDGGDHAYYLPGPDEIHVPPVTSYLTAEERYSTGFHEAGHSTGHPSRLNREGIAQWDEFGSDRYSREELVAEATSALLCAVTGIDTEVVFTNSAAYLANWARKLRDDPHLIVTAASQAFKAADLIQGISDEYAEHEPEHEQAVELAA